MKGDFSRFTYRPHTNYISVWKQQGRVDLDSDWNEQAEIWAEHFRQLTADILGPFAVPLSPNDITPDNSRALMISNYASEPGGMFDFTIGAGLSYVGGYPFILIKETFFRAQPDYPEPVVVEQDGDLLVYIEVWRRQVNYIDDDLIKEPGLAGPDTCLRMRLVGQVKVLSAGAIADPEAALSLLGASFAPGNVGLTLQIDESAHQIPLTFGEVDMGAGLIPGNLHYRAEIHRGVSSDGTPSEGLKWSDDNCAAVVRILKATDRGTLLVEEPEPILGESFKPGDWVEIANRITELHSQGSQMAQIDSLDTSSGGQLVRLDSEIHPMLARLNNGGRSVGGPDMAPRVRRWSGYIAQLTLKNVYDLGRGVKAVFHSLGRKHFFDSGEFWTFAIRDRAYNKVYAPQKALPAGIKRYRHPLAIIKRRGQKPTGEIIDCRKFFKPLAV